MKWKKLVALFVAVVLLFTNGVNVMAARISTDREVGLRWVNTSTIFSDLTFRGTTAECSVCIDGFSGTTAISATYELQRKVGNSYVTIKTWTASGSGYYLDWYDTYTVTAGYTYRLYITAKVTRNGTTETANGWTVNTLK